MDPAGLARGQTPGRPQRRRRAPTPPGTPGPVAAKPARLSLTPGHAHPRSITNFEPARSMTRIWQPDSGETPGTSVWKRGEAQCQRQLKSGSGTVSGSGADLRQNPSPWQATPWYSPITAALVSSRLSRRFTDSHPCSPLSGRWPARASPAACSPAMAFRAGSVSEILLPPCPWPGALQAIRSPRSPGR